MTRTLLLGGSAGLILSLSLMSCGGGGGFSRVDTGDVIQCPAADSYKPITGEIEKESNVSKVSWPQSASPDPVMDPGLYQYINMELYFVDTATNFQYHIRENPVLKEEKVATEDHQYSAVCVRNALNLKTLNLEFQFPSEVNVAAGGQTTTQMRTLSMSLNSKDPLVGKVKQGESKAMPPSKAMEDQNFSSQVYKIVQSDNTIVYQMQIVDESGSIKKWIKVDFLKKN